MRLNYTLLFILISALVRSQPEITQSSLPLIGDHVLIAICSNPIDPGEAGEMQTWDMSGLTESEEQFFTYMPVAEGPLADSFPNANLCAKSWLNDYSYYNISGNALTVEGFVVILESGDTAVTVFNNSEQILDLPFTFMSDFEDDFDANLYLPGFSAISIEGSVDFEVDGYGTLILPSGTYSNVLRYRMFREQNTLLNGFISGTQTKEQWVWVSSDYRFWLLLMEENFDGFSTSSLIWYDKNPFATTTNLQNPKKQEAKFAFPNPLRKNQDLFIKWQNNETATVSFYKTNGQLINRFEMVLSVGSNKFNFPKAGPGVYFLKIETNTNSHTQKISVLN